MPPSARVQSIEALESFRASLLVFLDKAGRILDDTLSDVVRTRGWLETDCRQNWRRQLRDKSKLLAQAEAELMTARLSGHPEAIQDRRMAVAKAKHAVEEVEAKVQRVERWIRLYEPEVQSKTQPVTRLRQVLGHDMLKASLYLESAANTLTDYADLTPAPSAAGSPGDAATAPAPATSEPAPPQP